MLDEMAAAGRSDIVGHGRVSWITLAAIVIVPAVLGLLVYQSFLGLWFWTDDFLWLRTAAESDANVAVREAFAYPRGASPYWRPLVDLYFFAMYNVFSLNATVYHVATLTIHVVAGMLLGLLALRLTKSGMIATLASGLFVISPTYSGMIPWATGVTAAMSGLFSVILALVFLRWLEGGGLRWLIFAALALAGALLSKEDAAALPAVLVLMTLAIKQPRHLRDIGTAGLLLLPLVVLWLAYAVPQFVAVVGAAEIPQFSLGWHAVPRLSIAMRWVSLPFPLSYGAWVGASRWAALGVFTLIALGSALRRAWLLPTLIPRNRCHAPTLVVPHGRLRAALDIPCLAAMGAVYRYGVCRWVQASLVVKLYTWMVRRRRGRVCSSHAAIRESNRFAGLGCTTLGRISEDRADNYGPMCGLG